jgi:hypothetical protein
MLFSQTNPNALKAIDDAARDSNVLILGDTNHSSLNLSNFLQSTEILDIAQRHGYSHIFLEIDAEFQDQVDKLRSGEITKDEFVNTMTYLTNITGQTEEEQRASYNRLSDFILQARDRGILVHFCDQGVGMSGINNRPMSDMLTRQAIRQAEEQGLLPEDYTPEFLRGKIQNDPEFLKRMQEIFKQEYESLSPEDQEKFQQEQRRLVQSMEDRLNDEPLANYINSIAPADQKILIIYGAAHELEPYLSARGRVSTIDIFTDPNEPLLNNPLLHPHPRIFLEGDRVETPTAPAQGMTQPQMNHQPTPAPAL